jgi:hypothetical protein
MNDCYRLLILVGLFLNSVISAAGQKVPSGLVTANFRNANIEQFVSELEKQTGLHSEALSHISTTILDFNGAK